MPDKTAPDWPGPIDLEQPTLKELFAKKRASGYDPVGLPMGRITPYTGIAGFTSAREVRAVAADTYTISGFGTPLYGRRQLAIGVLVSHETFSGAPPRKFPERYPAIGEVRKILDAASEPYVHRAPWQLETEGTTFDLHSRCLRMIHYNGPGVGLCARLDQLCDIAGPNLDGFQLNMPWPPAEEMKAWAMDHPTMRLVLQVNRRMYANVAQTPQRLVDEIAKTYMPWCLTDILFDLSGGGGRKIGLAQADEVLTALYGAFGGQVGIGLAGGLDWVAVWDLKPLFEKWPDLSIDAEGNIRDIVRDPKDREKILSNALGEAAREYARRAFSVMTTREPLDI
jgi:hypothetical protein